MMGHVVYDSVGPIKAANVGAVAVAEVIKI